MRWAGTAAVLHLGTSLVIGWLAFHAGLGVLARGGEAWLRGLALLWASGYTLLVGGGWLTGHLQSPRTSLLRLEEGRMRHLSGASLATIEGLNPCVLPWALWALTAPKGLVWTLALAALWSLAVSLTVVIKLWLRFPRHPRPWLGPLERRGDLLSGWVAVAAVLLRLRV